MSRLVIPFAAVLTLALGGCIYEAGGDPPPPQPLAADRAQPELALFEHALTAHFTGAGPTPPTTCAQLTPRPLSAEQEEALIVRFVRLAPAARCRVATQGMVDAETDGPAALVQVYEFSCRDADSCIGWVARPGAPATRYAMSWQDGVWRFTGDPRLLAE